MVCKYFAKPSIFHYIYINILLIMCLDIVDAITGYSRFETYWSKFIQFFN